MDAVQELRLEVEFEGIKDNKDGTSTMSIVCGNKTLIVKFRHDSLADKKIDALVAKTASDCLDSK